MSSIIHMSFISISSFINDGIGMMFSTNRMDFQVLTMPSIIHQGSHNFFNRSQEFTQCHHSFTCVVHPSSGSQDCIPSTRFPFLWTVQPIHPSQLFLRKHEHTNTSRHHKGLKCWVESFLFSSARMTEYCRAFSAGRLAKMSSSGVGSVAGINKITPTVNCWRFQSLNCLFSVVFTYTFNTGG